MPSFRASAISESVPYMPPTAITASHERTRITLRAWSMPVTTGMCTQRLASAAIEAWQEADHGSARLGRAARRGLHDATAPAREEHGARGRDGAPDALGVPDGSCRAHAFPDHADVHARHATRGARAAPLRASPGS